jgi:hypothetical protein
MHVCVVVVSCQHETREVFAQLQQIKAASGTSGSSLHQSNALDTNYCSNIVSHDVSCRGGARGSLLHVSSGWQPTGSLAQGPHRHAAAQQRRTRQGRQEVSKGCAVLLHGLRACVQCVVPAVFL